MTRFLFVSILCILLNSCNSLSGVFDDSEEVASCGGTALSRNHLEKFLPEGVNKKDSTLYAKIFIEQWLRNEEVKNQALNQFPEIEQLVLHKVEDYKTKLIIHEYNSLILEKQLDTFVPKKEIDEYYENSENSFIAKENLFSFFYVVTEFDGINVVKENLKEDDPEKADKLRKWVAENNVFSSILDSNFRNTEFMRKIQKESPIVNLFSYPKNDLIGWVSKKNNKDSYHFFKKIQYLPKGEKLPLHNVKDEIKKQIINQRKIQLVEKNEEKIVNEAKAQNKFKGI